MKIIYVLLFTGWTITSVLFGGILMMLQLNGHLEEFVSQSAGYPTGYDVWNEANRYRVSQGRMELVMDKKFCNNIGARAVHYRETNSHDGLDTFNKEWIQVENLVEILNKGNTAKEIVGGWAGSPSHNLLLLDTNRGCAYSDNGYSVMLLGY